MLTILYLSSSSSLPARICQVTQSHSRAFRYFLFPLSADSKADEQGKRAGARAKIQKEITELKNEGKNVPQALYSQANKPSEEFVTEIIKICVELDVYHVVAPIQVFAANAMNMHT